MPKSEPHITPEKTAEVESVKQLLQHYPIFGLVNMEHLPTLQLQRMRAKLKDAIHIKMAKKRLILRAFEQVRDSYPGLDKVAASMEGMPALIFTKENPFALYKLLEKNKTKAPAKPGQIAPVDLIIPAGPTPFVPGPMIGELGQLGIKTKVEGGKIAVMQDKVLVKKGEPIPPKAADLLAQLKIEPMDIGINMLLAYEHGTIFPKAVLAIDDAAYRARIQQASRESVALALDIGYMSKDIIEVLLHKAFRDSKALAVSQKILTTETVADMLAEAERSSKSIESYLPEEVVRPASTVEPQEAQSKEEIREPPKEEPKEETALSKGSAQKHAAEGSREKKTEKAKGAKYFKGKGPSTEELLKDLEKEEGDKEKSMPPKKDTMKEVEEITRKILGGKA